jgi:hypothetical protein
MTDRLEDCLLCELVPAPALRAPPGGGDARRVPAPSPTAPALRRARRLDPARAAAWAAALAGCAGFWSALGALVQALAG